MSSSSVKRAQKESLFFRKISELFLQASLDDDRLRGLTVNRVQLSSDKSTCNVFLYTPEGESAFNALHRVLSDYKFAMRRVLAASIASRYTPELVFKFDKQFEKQQRIEELLEKVKRED